ncbi:hypothetical protein [Sulfitobacter sabulilitoris]|uniref:Uncharacterized protein n=1 Tax=Sulfitobacter sabulilitoris TaxID=2562655 RepID=A0A5S3PLU3_9RHOB|nr:hypothetical protein [Sulfitobacter sabulilitoris]TMM55347.1 hypothetical protein FDT80_07290 [Sulfitobacter sabulilitoris]
MDFTDAPARRQLRYRARARRARWAARLMVPVCALTVSAALWTEPQIAVELKRGLETLQPLLEGRTAAAEREPAGDAVMAAADQTASLGNGLPPSAVQVRRAGAIAID